MDKFNADRVAHTLCSARRNRHQVETATLARLPQSIADAYAVQMRVMEEIGPVGGFKTNRQSDGTQIVAPIAARRVSASGVEFSAQDFFLIGIELEIAFRLEHPLPPSDHPDWAQELEQAFVAMPVLEIVDSRLVNHTDCDANMQLADNLSNGALVFGEPQADWTDYDLSAPQHQLLAGDRVLSTEAGAVPGGSALSLLQGFVRSIGDHCGGLVPGQIVTTGALSGVHWLTTDADAVEVSGSIEQFGSVACTVNVQEST